MIWKVELKDTARKELRKLDGRTQDRIKKFFRRIASPEDPRRIGKGLRGSRSDYWRYRVGGYRILCRIEDRIVTILVVEIGHRGKIYKG